MEDLRFDEGTFYLTLLPSPENPFTDQIRKFRDGYNWFGVIHPGGYAVVPFKVVYRSLVPKSREKIALFSSLLSLKIQRLFKQSVNYVFENSPSSTEVETWMEVVNGTAVTVVDRNVIAKARLGSIMETVLGILMSEIVAMIPDWQSKYGYVLDIERVEPVAILLGTLNDDKYSGDFKQRLYDDNIQMSAYKWDIALNHKRNFLWRTPWYKFVANLL